MLIVYEQWRGISFLGGHFSSVARGRKLCVLILVCLVSVLVGLCRVVQVCRRRLLFLVLCRKRGYLSWGYWCPCWGHWPVCGYTAVKRCLPNVPWSWLFLGTLYPGVVPWRTLTLWSGCPPLFVIIPVFLHQSKVRLPLVNLLSFVSWSPFLTLHPDRVHWCVTCCSLIWVQSDDDFRPYAQRAEGCGCPPLCHCGIFDPVFLCAECWGDLISYMEDPTAMG